MSASFRDVFSDHLDVCQQCEQHPFALCAEGERLIRQAVSDMSSMRIPPAKEGPFPQQKRKKP